MSKLNFKWWMLIVSFAGFQPFTEISAAQCPADIQVNDCAANDLQPTGTELISGPTACSDGEIISAKVRIKFENGGGANDRYSVAFFIGDNGESATGGASCTFESLNPVGGAIDLTSGSGGFLELNGDACGDISKGEPTYKDIQLDNLACKDTDGDGKLDLSYLLTWSNNAKQTSCADPNDPAQFEPSPPKCRSSLDYDLPIDVELAPSIEVNKQAIPRVLMQPGGLVSFPITIINTSPSPSDPVTITRIIDDPYGDISAATDCSLPFTLAPAESRTCVFTTDIVGQEGDVFPDTVTVTGEDDEGEPVMASDSAEVRIFNNLSPFAQPDWRIVKFAAPRKISEPGGMIRYQVLVLNISDTTITLRDLQDDLYGDLDGQGNCELPQVLAGSGAFYSCTFDQLVTGVPGDIVTDTITATSYSSLDSQTPLQKMDSASVEIIDVPSTISVTKSASPETVIEPGGTITYALRIQNNSVVDSVTINQLNDSILGINPGNCSTPITLQPGGDFYDCSFSGVVSGNAGDVVTNVVVATGLDDDGNPVTGDDAASVSIIGTDPSIEVFKAAVPSVALFTGSPVRYFVGIRNTSAAGDPVTITSLVDDTNGTIKDLNGQGTCDLDLNGAGLVLPPAPDPDSLYICSFTELGVSGPVGTSLVDVVTAEGVDDDGAATSASAQASVTFVTGAFIRSPELKVFKVAAPREILEPGGDVEYKVVMLNTTDTSVLERVITIDELTDNINGQQINLDGEGDCVLPIQIPAGEFRSCSFSQPVSGVPGDTVMDEVFASGTTSIGQRVTSSDTASVVILDVPSSITVSKTASPSSVLEPGADVTFSIEVNNASQVDSVTLTSLIDNVHGDLVGKGLCPALPTLAPGSAPYHCDFTVFVGGNAGESELNTVVASGIDDDGMDVVGQAQAEVSILDSPASLTAFKNATPGQVDSSGGAVVFTVRASNTSAIDSIMLNSLDDSVFGNLNGKGTCKVPQNLMPGASYTCFFIETLSGEVDSTHVNVVVAAGNSDDGDPVSAQDSAIVGFFTGIQAIPSSNHYLLLLLMFGLLFMGYRHFKRR